MMKFLYCDVETSGLDATRHGVIQIAGIIDINGEIVDEFNFHLQPFSNQSVSPESLEVNGITMEELGKFPKPKVVYKQLIELFDKHVKRFDKTDKFIMVGYNSTFDDTFLRAFFSNCEDSYYGSYIWWPTIDLASFAMEFLKEERHRFPNFKLATVAKALGIPIDDTKTHDALYDSHLARKIYRKIILNESVANND